MTDNERLIELIRKAKKNTKETNCDLEREMLFAEYLLANGVMCTDIDNLLEKMIGGTK